MNYIGPVWINSLEALVNPQNFVKQALHQARVRKTQLSEKLIDKVLILHAELGQVLV